MARQKSTQAHPRLAKLTPPRLPVVLHRARLFRELDCATKAPLTWLAAPPGAGKTTLLASYLQTRSRTTLWYRLDAGDADPSTLFHYLGLAVRAAAPRFRTCLPHLTPEYMAGLPTFTQRFFEQLGCRFARPTTIVFDNYHEVPLDSLIHQLLPVGIQQLPNQIRVMVLSRERPPASYARLQAEQQLETIQAAALELTREEAHQLSRLRRTARPKEDTRSNVDQVWEQTKGWMAGFILLWQHNEREKTVVSLAPHQSSQAIFDYLSGEVLERFRQDRQTLLLAVSILSDFTPQMAQELSSVPQTADTLEQLHQARYFVERREDRIGWYRFHPLFQEFLLRRAEQLWDHTVMRELRRKAAALLVEAQQAEHAIALLQQAQVWDDYRALVQAQAPLLAQQGRIHTLESWIRQLPDAERNADPWMDFWLANSRLLVAPQEASALYESAMTRFQQQGERAGMLLAWAGAVQSILVAWAGMKHIHELVRLFEEMHPEGTAYPSVEIEAVVAQAMAGAYMHMYTDRPQAREWLDRSVELSYALPMSMRASEMVMTTIYYIWLADGDKAQTLFDHQRKVGANETSVSMRVTMAIVESMLFWNRGQVDHCRNAVEKGLALAEEQGLLVWNGLLYAQAVYNELLFGNTQQARVQLTLMQPFAKGGGNFFILLMLAGWADLLDGNTDEARNKCRQARVILETEGFILWHTGMLHLLETQVTMAQGHPAEADRLLRKVEAIAQVLPGFHTFGICFLRAQWAFRDGDEISGTVWLRRLLEEQRKKNQQILFIGWVPQEASRLFAKALELDIEVPYVLEAIRKWQLKPPADGPVPETWPWRVKIRTFGKLAVEVDGKPLGKHRKAPHRLMELLAAIITFGGHDVPVSRLIDALWPEVDGDTGHENFKKSIARLRKLLAVEGVIRWEDGTISLNPELCWVDALAFERQARQNDGRAIGLYTGPFLGPDEVPAWAVSWRERMHATYVSLVKRREGREADRGQSIVSNLTSQATATQTSKSTASLDPE